MYPASAIVRRVEKESAQIDRQWRAAKHRPWRALSQARRYLVIATYRLLRARIGIRVLQSWT